MGVKASLHQKMSTENKSILHLAILFLLGLILFFSPFFKGLFNGYNPTFDSGIMSFQSFFFGVGILIAIYLMFRKTSALQSDIAQWVVWILPFLYVIPSLINPASSYYAGQAVIIQISFALAFTMGAYLNRTIFGIRFIITAILGSGAAIVVFGFMNWFGDASLWGLLNWNRIGGTVHTYQDAVMIGPDGARLTSIFQYANSYAAYLIAFILALFVLIVHNEKTKYVFLFSLFLVPSLISFLLTLSRGALLVFPIIVLVLLPFMKWFRQLYFMVYGIVAVGISLIFLSPITNLGHTLQQQFNSTDGLKGWGLLFLACLCSALVNTFLHRFVFRKIKTTGRTHFLKVPLNVFIPLFIILLGTAVLSLVLSSSAIMKLLPDNLQTRIENINFEQNSVLERGTFYSDSIKVVRDYPIFGAGGGAWANLYEKYQNNPYISSQTHNYFMQILVETGIVGLIVILGLLFASFYFFIRSYFKKSEDDRYPYLIYFIFVIAILIHSILDFNMSFIYLSLLVYLSLGGMLAIVDHEPYEWQIRLSSNKRYYIYPTALLGCCLVMFFLSINNLSSNNTYNYVKSNFSSVSFQQLNKSIDEAISKLNNPEYVDLKLQMLISAYDQTEDTSYVQEARSILQKNKAKEPYFKPFVYREIEILNMTNDFAQSAKLLESELPNYPWDMTMYSQLASAYLQTGLIELKKGSVDNAKLEWGKADILLKDVQNKSRYLETLPEHQYQGREFGLTPDFTLILGQIAFHQGDYNDSEQYLLQRMDQRYDDARDVETTIYYVATLRKLQKDDAAILQDMFSKVSSETKALAEEHIDSLMKQSLLIK